MLHDGSVGVTRQQSSGDSVHIPASLSISVKHMADNDDKTRREGFGPEDKLPEKFMKMWVTSCVGTCLFMIV